MLTLFGSHWRKINSTTGDGIWKNFSVSVFQLIGDDMFILFLTYLCSAVFLEEKALC